MRDESPEPAHPIVNFTFADLEALLKRAVRLTGALGLAVALILWRAMGWQTAALFAVGAGLSMGSIYEWGRLFRAVNARMDGAPNSGLGSGLGTGVVAALFVLRLAIFAAVIYGSLKCLNGSPIALLCGLGLGLAGFAWEAMRVLRG